jgi:hypothetical protein
MYLKVNLKRLTPKTKQIQCNPHQNTNNLLHRNRKKNRKFLLEPQKTSNNQINSKEKEAV